jgi:hypothetical protein
MIEQMLFVLFIVLGGFSNITSQTAVLKGRVVDSNSNEPITEAIVRVSSKPFLTQTNGDGFFYLSDESLPKGEQVLEISKENYIPLRIPITIYGNKVINLDPILLEIDIRTLETQFGTISITDDMIDDEVGITHSISGLLQASRDVFSRAAAYDFSATFFKPRGMDNSYGSLLINGVEMNKVYDGKPQWGNWGGLNDAQRIRNRSKGITANKFTFGGITGTTNISMRPSDYKQGGKFSYAMANRSYKGRVMESYFSGMNKNGWGFMAAVSRRFGESGFKEGTSYNANSFFVSIEKKFNSKHILNILGLYSPVNRGRSASITKEAYQLKGIKYNPNWGIQDGLGIQDGRIRNSKIIEIKEPLFMINHYFAISDKTQLNTNLAIQLGSIGSTRLEYGSQRNPFANYYQRMPSYFLRHDILTPYNYYQAYLAEQEFKKNGQLDWKSLYDANRISTNSLSAFVLQKDVVDDRSIIGNSILRTELSDSFTLNASIQMKKLKSERYAEIDDLLGGEGYLDLDYFSINDYGIFGNQTQSDLQNPNRKVYEGDRFNYNYLLDASVISGFGQLQFFNRKWDLFAGVGINSTSFQRTGIFENGHFPGERSLGESENIQFFDFGIKGGGQYRFNGRNFIELNLGYRTKAPLLKHVFSNPRQNNDIVEGLSIESIQNIDLSYFFRSPRFRFQISGFYLNLFNSTELGFYFTQNALGNETNNAFVQEIVTGISKQNTGFELGVEAEILQGFKLKGAASYGQNIYNNNPKLYLAGDDFSGGNDIDERGIREVQLKNYRVASGPEKAFQVGFEYRSDEYWWCGLTANYFYDSFIDLNYLRRTTDFHTDTDGQPFNGYNEETARELLFQESFPDYLLMNIVGGKSWKAPKCIIGFFASISNLLDQDYVSGGFENSRNSSYRQLLEEDRRVNGPLFGNHYFFGNGVSYYINTYIRF